MSFSALAAIECSCGSSPESVLARRSRDKTVAPQEEPAVPGPKPADDPDPTIRVLAQSAPCFVGPGYEKTISNIDLWHRLAQDKDDEALATLETKGVFIVLSPGTRFKVRQGENRYPHKWGEVLSKRYIGAECMIEGPNLVERGDVPREISAQEEAVARNKNRTQAEELLRKYGR